MSATSAPDRHADAALDGLIDAACEVIAPCWPLDRFIAVNPFHGLAAHGFRNVAGKMPALCGATLFMPRTAYREAWCSGAIRRTDLEAAVREAESHLSVEDCLDFLEAPERKPRTRPLLSGVLDAARDLRHEPAWEDTITQQISRFCASRFDRTQADWSRHATAGLYRDWIEAMQHEHGVAMLMHSPRLLRRVANLPRTPRGLVASVLKELDLTGEAACDLLRATLLRINGWAAWCAYLRWQARLDGGDDDSIVELLAIRLAWEQVLDDGGRGPASPWRRWREAWLHPVGEDPDTEPFAIWQRAREIGYQSRLFASLPRPPRPGPPATAARVQAVFCIDVRSEVIRRALETADPAIRTLGFAGFFGLPVAYRQAGSDCSRPQLPGLLKPEYTVSDDPSGRKAARSPAAGAQIRPFMKLPASAFTLVESLGMGYAAGIVGNCLPALKDRAAALRRRFARNGDGPQPRLVLDPDRSLETRARLAAGILRTMSLTADFAPLVMLVGHGSEAANNAHKAGLDCGACGGQTGEVNVRTLAGILNDPVVRQALRAEGIDVPDATHFLPALHNTTTDEVAILDEHRVPPRHKEELRRLRGSLAAAGAGARRERAARLGLDGLADTPPGLFRALRRRARDWSQTRPEWGLADNAAFVIGPRRLTAGTDLGGRVFLHDYDAHEDRDGSTLELLLTAPMIVTNWINLQYYASTVDNRRFGCGNKVLHNVVGGDIGVFEGNGGDLRVGLSMQSLHDGTRWMHTPLRLSVMVAAPRETLEWIVARHALVRDLVDNEWLFLFRLDPDGGAAERYRAGRWIPAEAPAVDG